MLVSTRLDAAQLRFLEKHRHSRGISVFLGPPTNPMLNELREPRSVSISLEQLNDGRLVTGVLITTYPRVSSVGAKGRIPWLCRVM